jgi:hypothetical protein
LMREIIKNNGLIFVLYGSFYIVENVIRHEAYFHKAEQPAVFLCVGLLS